MVERVVIGSALVGPEWPEPSRAAFKCLKILSLKSAKLGLAK
jgi:hypothetical protein